jgi:DNA recombination protein RmuC
MTTTILLIILIVLLILNIFLTITKKPKDNSEDLKTDFIKLDAGLSKVDPLIRDEFGRNREESQKSFKENREELNNSFKLLGDTLTKTVAELSNAQKGQFETFSNRQEQIKKDSELNLKEIRETVEKKLQTLQEENSKKLDEMRKVVDEKLQETVEKRFNESFKMISDRLEQVHKGLGEMQSLATGVGDLKKVLTNVKTRGNMGEIQLGAILEQILSPEQYELNASVKAGSLERVEFVVKLPDKNSDNSFVLLPIDSKFPNEDYQRLLETYDNTANLNPRDIELIVKQFENSVKKNAKDIHDKYINPPVTTDFAIMFVPTEGLYAEILRRTGLFETLQRDFKITVVGPTNLVAFLSSLQMGFNTLKIEKRSSEVWELLSAVKKQFGSFGDILDKTKKKLQEAANVIDNAGVKSRAIERKLRNVQELPSEQTIELFGEAIEIEEDSRVETDDNDE